MALKGAMLDVPCIFLLYAVQGAVQGAVFGSLPLLLRQNPAATDLHQSHFSIVGYPFSLKFLIAPFVDGIYLARLGRRESWLLPLQLLTALLLIWMASRVGPMLEASPPEVAGLSALMLVLVAAAAATDIATDAWAAGRMNDSNASLCQALGLTVGFEASSTFFFFLKGKGLMDVGLLFFLIGVLAFVLLAFFVAQMLLKAQGAPPVDDGEAVDEVGVGEVLRRVRGFCRIPNVRWWVVFSVLIPVLRGHGSVQSVRYQALGFSPEIFSEYDLFLLPVSFVVMWLGGKIAQTHRLMSAFFWTCVFQILVSIGVQAHFWQSGNIGQAAVQDGAMRAMYVCLNQLSNAVATIQFVVNVAVFNRISQSHQAIAGTVITFLASVSNLGGMLPGTWAPLVVDIVGINALAALCLGVGSMVLAYFRLKLQRMEDMQDVGWLRPDMDHPHQQ
mmetsp:Transcript_120953/g.342168  ORF Transcript_120953/g.342168 Transcript_120953/m.342168 type:complete len:445 (+) Transcript_120953:71-1405(+)